MTTIDYVVLVVYFLAMAVIGVWSMLKIKKQEDFFLGGRSFGKILQAFAVFGAGTGSHEPVAVGRTTYTSGLSGIWSVFLWLFCTPFYWFFAVWYRRMRHLTLGDWFVERYQSKPMGVAYLLYGIAFYMFFLALGFSAVGKMCAPLIEVETLQLPWRAEPVPIEFVLVPIIAVVVAVYGVLGGLRAAYWTDLIQGVFIILLSVLLIPSGLQALVDKFGDPQTMGMLDGFQVLHERVSADYFKIFETPRGGEFPLHYILGFTCLGLIGIVVQPHFIAIGGGSAKTEMSARVGLVGGVFMKRLCSVGWALTALIVLALMADNLEIAEDPDAVWGVAAREILGPFQLGLVGLMLACLIAALMSSADCYMLIVSALVVRNFYAAYVKPDAGEKECVLVGRIVGALIIAGGVVISLCFMNIFEQLKIALELPLIFAAPFWVGLCWRRATRSAAWLTLAFSTVVFFVLPLGLPMLVPSLAQNPQFTVTNDVVTSITTRPAAPADVARREAEIGLWDGRVGDWVQAEGPQSDEAKVAKFGPRPEPIVLGKMIEDKFTTGGKPVYFKDRIEVRGPDGQWQAPRPEHLVETERVEEGRTTIIHQQFRPDCTLRGQGRFNLEFVIYERLGLELKKCSNAALETFRLPARLILPFVVIILLSLITPQGDREKLDRYYVKMKTPVDPDPKIDAAEVEASYRDPSRFDYRRLFPFFGLEIQKPKLLDIAGFVVAFAFCFGIIGLTAWLANLGS
ncbi:MAG: sodium:solute symporter family protein [Planctomycetes bacterium]|nr:sodium:solute symporter family protein [Planctomycetota bacterium]MBL7044134.1 sodium:solute symporter family protein [Pirellulaceae bacterium]